MEMMNLGLLLYIQSVALSNSLSGVLFTFRTPIIHQYDYTVSWDAPFHICISMVQDERLLLLVGSFFPHKNRRSFELLPISSHI
jgi:hypothetical protein